MDLDEHVARSNVRARRGRHIARLAFAATLGLVVTFVVAISPGLFFTIGQNGLRGMSPLLGILGVLIGLGWMFRILRTDHDPDSARWRYRDF